MAKHNPSAMPCQSTLWSQFIQRVDYSLIHALRCDPQAIETGEDHNPRQVFSGHYVLVKPTPLPQPRFIAHSHSLFQQLGLDDELTQTQEFQQFFSGDLSFVSAPIRHVGWATGYALSIFGREYTQQCPFLTGNGYGDGRAISVLELAVGNQHWELQLKGAGRTPYCRGGDGRAVLRSSVREFLVQEHMHALGIPTSRSLCLFVSHTETVQRPWYREGSHSVEPDQTISEPVAITTRVAPSFLRVGQLELFARRARRHEHPNAQRELEMIVNHLIKREYNNEVDQNQPFIQQLLQLAETFQARLTSLVANWIRVGYCQGNFNSDNCAAGGYTLDYGPFGFCELFEPFYQPWIGGGEHFAFFNQPAAAQANFDTFCQALRPLFSKAPQAVNQLDEINRRFSSVMQNKMRAMWRAKLGLNEFDQALFEQLLILMMQTPVDYTLFFRELSQIPTDVAQLGNSFYQTPSPAQYQHWAQWLKQWRQRALANASAKTISQNMQRVNPKYTWREWQIAPAYHAAKAQNYTPVQQLQALLIQPYDEQSTNIEQRFYRRKPQEFFHQGGISHYSCSS